MRNRPAPATAIIAAILVLACQSAAAPTGTPGGSAPPGQPGESGAPTTGVAPTDAPVELPPTSEELIGTALEAGTITYEQSLLYRALALYDSPGLPTDFRSALADMHAAGELMGEIDDHEAELSAGALAQLAPYRARPADPISIFNNPPARAGADALLAVATVPTWHSRPAAGGAARVWVKASADEATQLTAHSTEVSKVWAALPPFFTYPEPDQPDLPDHSVNPDTAIDFYFVDATDLDPRRAACVLNPALQNCVFGAANDGFAQRAEENHGTSSSGYLVIDAAGSGVNLLDTLAHELTHAGQFAYDRNESKWLYESTATWVAYRVIKSFGESPDYEYEKLPRFFAALDQKLTRLGTKNRNAYDSWLYFMFASMEEGDSIVKTIWEAAAAEGQQGERAIDNVFAFEEHFADFAMRDWNRAPVERLYKTYDDTFPRNMQPKVKNADEKLPAGAEQQLDVRLPALGSAYFSFVPGIDARTITFDNSLVGIAGAHVWAIRNIKDTWQRPEDWTDVAHKEFCRDIDDQDLWQLVIVVSNADMTADLKPAELPRVAATAKGCGGWKGTMTATHTWNTNEGHGTATSTFEGLWVEDKTTLMPCDSPNGDDCTVYLPNGTIKWTWDSHWNSALTNMPCDETTSGSLPAGNQLHPDVQSLVLTPLDADSVRYSGLGSFILESFKCTVTTGGGGGYPPEFFDISGGASSTNKPGDGDTCWTNDWVIDATGNSIAGACFAYEYTYNALHFEWNLQRVGPAPDG